ncbi:hypothetical protein ZOSMA_98G00580 [Zostera marina]|uniref:Uncharacterized protein n=1 Tax=Zostera marina TaxID=29655 RepID=A0A0K9NHJ0_ZOSMR|nr:hypothetical protein ZOSMA_98G00580 [Zostera marina]
MLMVCIGGKKRTEMEYRSLAKKARFSCLKIPLIIDWLSRLPSAALASVHLQHGLDQVEELEKLCDQVARLTKEVSVTLEDRDRMIVDASKDADTQRTQLAEMREQAANAEKLRIQGAEENDALVKAGHDKLMAELMLGFKTCLAETMDESER